MLNWAALFVIISFSVIPVMTTAEPTTVVQALTTAVLTTSSVTTTSETTAATRWEDPLQYGKYNIEWASID